MGKEKYLFDQFMVVIEQMHWTFYILFVNRINSLFFPSSTYFLSSTYFNEEMTGKCLETVAQQRNLSKKKKIGEKKIVNGPLSKLDSCGLTYRARRLIV